MKDIRNREDSAAAAATLAISRFVSNFLAV